MNPMKSYHSARWMKVTGPLFLAVNLVMVAPTVHAADAAQAGRVTDASGMPVTSGAGECVNAVGGVTDPMQQCGDAMPTAAPVEAQVEIVATPTAATITAKKMEKITIAASMLFAFDSSELSDDAKAVIDERIQALGGEAKLTSVMKVVGYTDSTGPETYNQQLSERRAKAVADYIIARAQRVGSSDIEVIGMGEADPIATNATSEGRAKNRRVDIFAQGEIAN